MRTFAHKQSQPLKEASTNRSLSHTATSAPNHHAHPILHLQRTIGNQAVQRILQTNRGVPTGFSSGTGQEIPNRARMEATFGSDFSAVRAYLGSRTAMDALGAEAATAGEAIAFATDRPDPSLVAHELAHVVQQRRGLVPRNSSQGIVDSPALEAQADVAAQAAVAGRPVPSLFGTSAPPVASPVGVQLQEKEKTPSPILYVGVTENAPAEAKKLEAINKDRGGVKAITTTDPQEIFEEGGVTYDLKSEDGIKAFAKSLGLAPGDEQKVINLLVGREGWGLDELAAIIKVYAATEADPGTPRMKRVVLSGHSGDPVIGGWGGEVSFESLVKLAQIYPKAAGQVEHLHMSGCSTGGEVTMEQYYLKAFPNVRTIWAYAGVCPSKGGALSALEKWEAATEAPGVKNLPKQPGVATWGEGGYQGREPMPLQEALDLVNGLQPLFEEYFNGTKADSNPEAGQLTDYYRLLVRVVGRPGLADAERKRLRGQQQVALRLRFYPNVRKHFMAAHGKTIKEGYDALKLSMPDYAALSRKDALKSIKDFALAASGSQPAAKALELLEKGLQNLTPEVILSGWIL